MACTAEVVFQAGDHDPGRIVETVRIDTVELRRKDGVDVHLPEPQAVLFQAAGIRFEIFDAIKLCRIDKDGHDHSLSMLSRSMRTACR